MVFFKTKTDILEGEKNINLHVVWQTMDEIKARLEYNPSDSEIVDEMKSAGRIYIGHHLRIDLLKPNMLHNVAVFLNPIMRSLRKLSQLERNEVHSFTKSLISVDPNKHISQCISQPQPQRITHRKSSFVDDFMELEDSEVDLEFQRYLNLVINKTDYENFILKDWWNKNKLLFPNLYKVFLRVQSTSTS